MWERHWDHIAGRVFVDTRQQEQRQDSGIITHPANEISKDHAVHQPVRVIGHKDHRTRFGNACKLIGGGQQVNPHDIQRSPPKSPPFNRAFLFKATDKARDTDFSGQKLNNADGVALYQIIKRVRIRQATAIIDAGGLCAFVGHSDFLCRVGQLINPRW